MWGKGGEGGAVFRRMFAPVMVVSTGARGREWTRTSVAIRGGWSSCLRWTVHELCEVGWVI